VSLDLLRSAGLVIGAGGAMRDRVTEEISLIRHQVVRTVASAESGQGRSGRIILVTSARPGEGKTFVSLNLAGSIAVAGSAPVLLVDADGKRGSLTELLGLAQAPGLRQLAAGATVSAPKLFTATTELPRLSFLPYGPAGDGPPTTSSGSSPSAAAILRLSRNLPDHLIILDSPPCLATSDPTGLAAVAGQVLMVVQAERTQRAEVEAALDLVDACPVLQLVLNKIRVANNDGFGSYSYDSAYLGRSDAAGG
jgi:receptor protein-tyrosine kinase